MVRRPNEALNESKHRGMRQSAPLKMTHHSTDHTTLVKPEKEVEYIILSSDSDDETKEQIFNNFPTSSLENSITIETNTIGNLSEHSMTNEFIPKSTDLISFVSPCSCSSSASLSWSNEQTGIIKLPTVVIEKSVDASLTVNKNVIIFIIIWNNYQNSNS
jgi:hypothetical protein